MQYSEQEPYSVVRTTPAGDQHTVFTATNRRAAKKMLKKMAAESLNWRALDVQFRGQPLGDLHVERL